MEQARAYVAASIGGNAWVALNDGGYVECRKVFIGGLGLEPECVEIASILSDKFSQAPAILECMRARAASIRMDGGSAYEATKAALNLARSWE